MQDRILNVRQEQWTRLGAMIISGQLVRLGMGYQLLRTESLFSNADCFVEEYRPNCFIEELLAQAIWAAWHAIIGRNAEYCAIFPRDAGCQ